jgi:hypothetical protein
MIIPAGDQTTESEMKLAVVAFLTTCAYGEAPFTGSDGLFFNLPSYIQLTPADREISRSRPTEMKWFSTVRNVYRSGIRNGLFVKRRGGGLQLAARVRNNSAAAIAAIPRQKRGTKTMGEIVTTRGVGWQRMQKS